MQKFIHNKSLVEKTYQGIPIDPGVFFAIPEHLEKEYSISDALIADLASGVVCMAVSGSTDLTGGANKQIMFLKNGTMVDASGMPIFKTIEKLQPEDTLMLSTFGLRLEANLNGVTVCDKVMPQAYYLQSGIMFIENSSFGDTIISEIVDVSNLLRYGAGTVLSTYVPEWEVWNGRIDLSNKIVGKLPIPGLFLRVKYNSVAILGLKPTVRINLLSYVDI